MKRNAQNSRFAAVQKTVLEGLPAAVSYGERQYSPYLKETVYRWTLQNGLTVLFLPKEMTTTAAQFTVRFGAADLTCRTASGKTTLPMGIAHFIEHSLFTLEDGSDVNEQFSALGADSNAWTDGEKTTYLFSTSENPTEALRLLLRFVTHGHFSQTAVDRERGIIREEIRMGDDNPTERMDAETLQALYPCRSVGKPICGTKRSVEKITPELLERTYRTYYRPANAFVTVCGDVSAEDVIETVVSEVGAWNPAGEAPLPQTALRTNRVRARTEKKAALSQPMFSIGWRDRKAEKAPDSLWYRATVMQIISEAIFARAGCFYGELYEKGALSGYDYDYDRIAGVGYHMVCGDADEPEKVWETYWKYVRQSKEKGISRQEFARCRRIVLAGLLQAFDDPEDVANLLMDAEEEHCGAFDVLHVLDTVTPEDVNACLREALEQEDTTFTVFTPRKKTASNGK